MNTAEGASCPLETHVIARNVQMFLSRLPKKLQDPFRDQFRRVDTAVLDYYPALMPYLLAMDRAHVFATDIYGHYHLAGLFASFPSDMDGEIKRFGCAPASSRSATTKCTNATVRLSASF